MENKFDTSSSRAISCLLCGGHFIYPGPKYPNHLLACHGVVSDIVTCEPVTRRAVTEDPGEPGAGAGSGQSL